MKAIQIFITKDRRALSALTAIVILLTLVIIGQQTSANTGHESVAPVESTTVQAGRKMRVVSTNATAGGPVTISVELDSMGDEVAASFTVNFDPTIFSYQFTNLGLGAPSGTTLSLNTNDVLNGRLGVLVYSGNPFSVSAPPRQVVSIRFNVAADAPAGATPVSFVPSPTPLSISSLAGVLLSADYVLGTVTVAPAAPTFVTVGGKVTTPTGQNLRNAVVTITDPNNVRRTATTSSFGLFSFDNVQAGSTYTLTVASKRYRFSPLILAVTDNVTNINFVGLE